MRFFFLNFCVRVQAVSFFYQFSYSPYVFFLNFSPYEFLGFFISNFWWGFPPDEVFNSKYSCKSPTLVKNCSKNLSQFFSLLFSNDFAWQQSTFFAKNCKNFFTMSCFTTHDATCVLHVGASCSLSPTMGDRRIASHLIYLDKEAQQSGANPANGIINLIGGNKW